MAGITKVITGQKLPVQRVGYALSADRVFFSPDLSIAEVA